MLEELDQILEKQFHYFERKVYFKDGKCNETLTFKTNDNQTNISSLKTMFQIVIIKLINETVNKFGKLDIIVNNVSISNNLCIYPILIGKK